MFSYRLIIKRALNIAWQHKYLWILGLFASVVAASGSFEYQFLSGNFQEGVLANPYHFLNSFMITLESIGLVILGFIDLFSYNILTIINTLTFVIIVGSLLVAFIWLSVSSQGGLVAASQKLINSKKKLANLSIRKYITIGHQNFWPVLSLNIIVKAVIAIILSLTSIPLLILSTKYSVSLTLLYTLAFIILVPLTIAFSLMIKYAIAYIVLDNENFIDAVRKSWIMFRKNWLVSVEMGVIIFLITFVVGFLLLLGLSVIILPYFIFAVDYGIVWLIILLATITLSIILIAGSFLTTFQITAWTNIFLELKNGNGQAKLERIFEKK